MHTERSLRVCLGGNGLSLGVYNKLLLPASAHTDKKLNHHFLHIRQDACKTRVCVSRCCLQLWHSRAAASG